MPARFIADQGFGFSGKAIETISGGQLVRAVSGTTVLTATNSLTNVIELALVDAAADAYRVVGMATQTGVSGDRIGVMARGIGGFYAAALVEAGSLVQVAGAVTSADAVTTTGVTADSGAQLRFGRALSTAASGQQVAVVFDVS